MNLSEQHEKFILSFGELSFIKSGSHLRLVVGGERPAKMYSNEEHGLKNVNEQIHGQPFAYSILYMLGGMNVNHTFYIPNNLIGFDVTVI